MHTSPFAQRGFAQKNNPRVAQSFHYVGIARDNRSQKRSTANRGFQMIFERNVVLNSERDSVQRKTNTISFAVNIAGGSDLKRIRIELKKGADVSIRLISFIKG